jgi:hypothetical protein
MLLKARSSGHLLGRFLTLTLFIEPKDSPASLQIKEPISDSELAQKFMDICPRHETVGKLANLIEQSAVVHVRGTPSTGKSILAELLYRFFVMAGRKAILTSQWDHTKGKRLS